LGTCSAAGVSPNGHHRFELSLQGLLVKGEGLAAVTVEDQVRVDSHVSAPGSQARSMAGVRRVPR